MTALSGSQYKPPALPEVVDFFLIFYSNMGKKTRATGMQVGLNQYGRAKVSGFWV